MHFSFAQNQVAAETLQSQEDQAKLVFGTYEEMRGVVVDLFGQQRYAEAAAILAGAVPRYPDHVLANTFNLALMYTSSGNLEEAVRALEEGHQRCPGKWTFDGAPWDTLRGSDGFQNVIARNEELIAEAQKEQRHETGGSHAGRLRAGAAVPPVHRTARGQREPDAVPAAVDLAASP